jgi:hypothetical protein
MLFGTGYVYLFCYIILVKLRNEIYLLNPGYIVKTKIVIERFCYNILFAGRLLCQNMFIFSMKGMQK